MACKKHIIIATANRAETNLLIPVFQELQKIPGFNVGWLQVNQHEPINNIMEYLNDFFSEIKPDLVVIPTDRIEMLPVAWTCLLKRIRTAHFEAGYPFVGGTLDDPARWSITLCADIIFCNSHENHSTTKKIMKLLKKTAKIYLVGSTAFDYQFEYSEVPNEPYDLVIYHPPTLSLENMRDELKRIESLIKNRYVVWLDPNGDEGSDYIISARELLSSLHDFRIHAISNLPKPKFLGLLEMCSRLIGNSSCLWQEAPALKVKTIPVGIRNSNRKKLTVRKGASKRIAKILSSIL